MKKPKVSVLTPIYNTNPQWLREMIESVLAQTFTDFEFILLNDSGRPEKERLARIVKSYRDPRIVYVENKKNMGLTFSRNKLIDLARGEYLAIRDHDDISKPDMFQKEVEFLDANPNIGVVSCNIHYFPNGLITEHPENNLEIKRKLTQGCYFAHPASMIRKSILIESGVRYEQEYSPSEDYMLFVRLISHTMFHNLQDVLMDYRNEETNTTHLQSKKMQDATALIRDFANRNHPYLSGNLVRDMPRGTIRNKSKEWLRLFSVIPFIKLKRKANGNTKFYLFGFIPLLYRK